MAGPKAEVRKFTNEFNLYAVRGEGVVSEEELERAKLKNKASRAPVLSHVAGLDANVERLIE